MYANLKMPEKDREVFYSHMGHSSEVNKNVYQCPPAFSKLQQVGSFLAQVDDNRRNFGENLLIVEENKPENKTIQEITRISLD